MADAADLDFLAAVDDESARFAAAIRRCRPDAVVPSCPEWTARDLLAHLTQVQWFWGQLVVEQITDDDEARRLDAAEPIDWASDPDPVARFERVSADLVAALSAHAPDTEVWTWSHDHSVGFIRRRQAHEALIHRVDAELALGRRSALPTALANDGVDEVLRVMFGGAPDFGQFTPTDGHTLRFECTDSDRSWSATLGRFTGQAPSGEELDLPDLRILDETPESAATIRGAAADLDCWLWNRSPQGVIQTDGDAAVLAAFEELRQDGIQ